MCRPTRKVHQQENSVDTKDVNRYMRGCKSKDRQYNGHKKQDNETSNYTDKLKITQTN